MEIIDRKQYTNISNIGKRFFIHRITRDNEIFYIFKLEKILDENPIKYKTERQYYLCVPRDIRTTCFCYDNADKIELTWDDKVYQISEEEYLEIFRKFVNYDGKNKNDVNLNF